MMKVMLRMDPICEITFHSQFGRKSQTFHHGEKVKHLKKHMEGLA